MNGNPPAWGFRRAWITLAAAVSLAAWLPTGGGADPASPAYIAFAVFAGLCVHAMFGRAWWRGKALQAQDQAQAQVPPARMVIRYTNPDGHP